MKLSRNKISKLLKSHNQSNKNLKLNKKRNKNRNSFRKKKQFNIRHKTIKCKQKRLKQKGGEGENIQKILDLLDKPNMNEDDIVQLFKEFEILPWPKIPKLSRVSSPTSASPPQEPVSNVDATAPAPASQVPVAQVSPSTKPIMASVVSDSDGPDVPTVTAQKVEDVGPSGQNVAQGEVVSTQPSQKDTYIIQISVPPGSVTSGATSPGGTLEKATENITGELIQRN